MNATLPAWVQQAAPLPIAFAQVREDPLIDRWVVDRLPAQARVTMVASGGCTAALVAAAPQVAQVHLVDPNPAQVALSLLKLRLLQTSDPATRLALLGHAPMDTAQRSARLRDELTALGLPAEALGPMEFVAEVGPDHAGRYESVFAALRQDLGACADEIETLLQLSDPPEQQRRVAPSTDLGRRLDESLDGVMSLPILVRLFGEEATRNPVEPFSRHFARRLRHVLATLPAARNPYLWQMLRGCYPESAPSPWLSQPNPARLARITPSIGLMAEALEAEPASADFIHLSNILDWLPPEQAQATLETAWKALRTGGWLVIRQLNSSLDIPGLGRMFDWRKSEATRLHPGDRSFFYRALHLGRKG